MFEIQPIEILAMRKLALVSKALASTLSYGPQHELGALNKVLTDVLDRYEIEVASQRESAKV